MAFEGSATVRALAVALACGLAGCGSPHDRPEAIEARATVARMEVAEAQDETRRILGRLIAPDVVMVEEVAPELVRLRYRQGFTRIETELTIPFERIHRVDLGRADRVQLFDVNGRRFEQLRCGSSADAHRLAALFDVLRSPDFQERALAEAAEEDE